MNNFPASNIIFLAYSTSCSQLDSFHWSLITQKSIPLIKKATAEPPHPAFYSISPLLPSKLLQRPLYVTSTCSSSPVSASLLTLCLCHLSIQLSLVSRMVPLASKSNTPFPVPIVQIFCVLALFGSLPLGYWLPSALPPCPFLLNSVCDFFFLKKKEIIKPYSDVSGSDVCPDGVLIASSKEHSQRGALSFPSKHNSLPDQGERPSHPLTHAVPGSRGSP